MPNTATIPKHGYGSSDTSSNDNAWIVMIFLAASFAETPLGTTLIGAACMGMIVLVGAALKIVLQLARLEQQVKSLHDDLLTMKTDPDIMRWSNYGRAQQATQGQFPKGSGI